MTNIIQEWRSQLSKEMKIKHLKQRRRYHQGQRERAIERYKFKPDWRDCQVGYHEEKMMAIDNELKELQGKEKNEVSNE